MHLDDYWRPLFRNPPSLRGNCKDFNWHDALRGPSAIAEFPVHFWEAHLTYPWSIMAKFGAYETTNHFVDSQCTLKCQISSRSVYYLLPVNSDKTQSFLYFQLWHHVVAPLTGVETKLNMGAQLYNLPFSNYIKKPLLSSWAFWAKSLSRTLPFKSVTEYWQTDTSQKTQHFWLPRWHAKSEPH